MPAPPAKRPSIWIIVPTYNERENVGPITDGDPRDRAGRARPDRRRRLSRRHRRAGRRDGPRQPRDRRPAPRRPSRASAGPTWPPSSDAARPRRRHRGPDGRRLQPSGPVPAVAARAAASTGRADLVLGSRYVKGGQIPRWNIFRRLVSRGGSVFAGVVLLMPYRDLTGGFKAWRAGALRAIDLDRLHAGGYAFQIETTFQARLAGARIVEVPITFEERRAGTVEDEHEHLHGGLPAGPGAPGQEPAPQAPRAARASSDPTESSEQPFNRARAWPTAGLEAVQRGVETRPVTATDLRNCVDKPVGRAPAPRARFGLARRGHEKPNDSTDSRIGRTMRDRGSFGRFCCPSPSGPPMPARRRAA